MNFSSVLITGGLGFIGLETAKQLVEKVDKIILLDNLSPQIHGEIPVVAHEILQSDKIHIIRADITNISTIPAILEGVDAIIHLAAETGTAQSMYQIAHYNNVNSQGTAFLLQHLQNIPNQVKKIVLSSSRSVYGEGAFICNGCSSSIIRYPEARTKEQLARHQWDPLCPVCGAALSSIPTPEDARVRPASIYAATKYAQEDLIRIGCEALGISSVILRFQNVYGEGQSLNNPYTGILSIFSTRIRQGKSLPIFEDGLESRDFIHVSDVSRAIISSLYCNTRNGEVINVGAGAPTSVMAIASMLVRKMGGLIQPEVTAQYRLGDIRHCYADMRKASELLAFTPMISLDIGLDRFVSWVNTQPLPEDKLDKANAELKKFHLMS